MRMDTGMKWIAVYFLGLFGLVQLLAGCNNPTKVMNLITPDRLGIGEVKGHITGSTNFTQEWYPDGHFDADWDSDSTMIWLEWDFPSWEEPDDYDRYLRERVRTLNLEKHFLIAEKELYEEVGVVPETVGCTDESLSYEEGCVIPEREVDEMWPKKLTEQY